MYADVKTGQRHRTKWFAGLSHRANLGDSRLLSNQTMGSNHPFASLLIFLRLFRKSWVKVDARRPITTSTRSTAPESTILELFRCLNAGTSRSFTVNQKQHSRTVSPFKIELGCHWALMFGCLWFARATRSSHGYSHKTRLDFCAEVAVPSKVTWFVLGASGLTNGVTRVRLCRQETRRPC